MNKSLGNAVRRVSAFERQGRVCRIHSGKYALRTQERKHVE